MRVSFHVSIQCSVSSWTTRLYVMCQSRTELEIDPFSYLKQSCIGILIFHRASTWFMLSNHKYASKSIWVKIYKFISVLNPIWPHPDQPNLLVTYGFGGSSFDPTHHNFIPIHSMCMHPSWAHIQISQPPNADLLGHEHEYTSVTTWQKIHKRQISRKMPTKSGPWIMVSKKRKFTSIYAINVEKDID